MLPISSESDGQFAGSVKIGAHSLYIEVHGILTGSNLPERPTTVIIQGIGSTIREWPAAIRGLAKLSDGQLRTFWLRTQRSFL